MGITKRLKSFRCSSCQLAFPITDTEEFKRCPICQRTCWASLDRDPMSEFEARLIKSHAIFRRFYEQWDRTRDLDTGEVTDPELRRRLLDAAGE